MKKITIEVGKIHNIENLGLLEMEALEQFCHGKGVAGIAKKLGKPYNTILKTRKKLYQIFNVKNEVSLIFAAINNKVIEIEFK